MDISINMVNGNIKSRIVFLISKIKTRSKKAVLIPASATSKKLFRSLEL
jgi:hypothetical protein